MPYESAILDHLQDGVLKQGEVVLPEAKEALNLLVKRRSVQFLLESGLETI